MSDLSSYSGARLPDRTALIGTRVVLEPPVGVPASPADQPAGAAAGPDSPDPAGITRPDSPENAAPTEESRCAPS